MTNAIELFIEEPTPYHSGWQPWVSSGVAGAFPLGPTFDERSKATRVLSALAAALRAEGAELKHVIIIVDTEPLILAIEDAIEEFYNSLGDMKHRELADMGVAEWAWVETLQSVIARTELHGRDTVLLDFDQADIVADTLPSMIETEEDFLDDEEVKSTIDIPHLRRYARQLQDAGFPFERPYGPDGKYVVKLAGESQENPYAVWADGREVRTVQTLSAGWELMRELAGPPAGAQMTMPTEGSFGDSNQRLIDDGVIEH